VVLGVRVARWYTYFNTKNAAFVTFLKTTERKILVNFMAIGYRYFMDIWNILWSFGTLFPILVSYTIKNLATLFGIQTESEKSDILSTQPTLAARGFCD
jgi:hypothetical protein